MKIERGDVIVSTSTNNHGNFYIVVDFTPKGSPRCIRLPSLEYTLQKFRDFIEGREVYVKKPEVLTSALFTYVKADQGYYEEKTSIPKQDVLDLYQEAKEHASNQR